MDDEGGTLDIEQVLSQIGESALSKKPSRFKMSIEDLAQIPWIRSELEDIKREEERYLRDQDSDDESDANVVTVRTLDESYVFSQQEVEEGTWTQKLVRKALRTKPITATHVTFIVK